MIGSFAGIRFRVSQRKVITFSSLAGDVSAKYTDHEVIGGKAKREYLGANLKNLSFSIQLCSNLGARVMPTIKKLERITESGKVSNFILGGENMGKFTIESCSTAYEKITARGEVTSAKVDLSLKEYH